MKSSEVVQPEPTVGILNRRSTRMKDFVVTLLGRLMQSMKLIQSLCLSSGKRNHENIDSNVAVVAPVPRLLVHSQAVDLIRASPNREKCEVLYTYAVFATKYTLVADLPLFRSSSSSPSTNPIGLLLVSVFSSNRMVGSFPDVHLRPSPSERRLCFREMDHSSQQWKLYAFG
jgi:hypothetical protein